MYFLRVYLKIPQRCSILPKSPICCVAFACIPPRSAALMRLASGAFWRIFPAFLTSQIHPRQPFLLLAPAGVVQAKPQKPFDFPQFQKMPGSRAEMSGPGIRGNLQAGRILSLDPSFWSSTVLHVMLGKMCFIKFHLNSFKRCILIQKLRSMKIGAVRVVRCTIFYCSVMIRCFQKTVFLAAVQCTVRTGCTALSL